MKAYAIVSELHIRGFMSCLGQHSTLTSSTRVTQYFTPPYMHTLIDRRDPGAVRGRGQGWSKSQQPDCESRTKSLQGSLP